MTGWTEFENSCYYFNTEKGDSLVWEDARDKCKAVGASLPIIKSQAESVFLSNNLPSTGAYWIGLRCMFQ